MAVEDVQYLLRHSEQDSVQLFIDSSMRNRSFCPTPAHYTVDLEEPIKHVFGIEVLDATIPSTMYNVDRHNNEVSLISVDRVYAGTGGTGGTGGDLLNTASADAALDELGYSPQVCKLCAARDTVSKYVVLDDEGSDDAPGAGAGAGVGSSFLGAVKEVDAAHPGASAPPPSGTRNACYVLLRTRLVGIPVARVGGEQQQSSSALRLLPSSPDAASPTILGSKKGVQYVLTAPHLSPDVVAVVGGGEEGIVIGGRGSGSSGVTSTPTPYAVLPASVPWNAPRAMARGADASVVLRDVLWWQLVRVPSQLFEAIELQLLQGGGGEGGGGVRMSGKVMNVALEVGNYTTATLQLQLQQQLQAVAGLDVASTSSGAVDKQSRYRVVGRDEQRFALVPGASTARMLLGFDEHAQRAENGADPSLRRYAHVPFGGDQNEALYASVRRVNPSTGGVSQMIEIPGIVNLLGVRYITLRCPEIEQHMGAAGKYGRFSTGIGTFKLANTNELAQLRFDFVSLIRRPFHPIGRLTRLTLRFEVDSDGTLYDFKGINHQLLITVKYYRATPPTGAAAPLLPSVLNPDYNPDFMQYLNTQSRALARGQADRGYDDEPDLDGDGAHDGPDMREVARVYHAHDFFDNTSGDEDDSDTDSDTEDEEEEEATSSEPSEGDEDEEGRMHEYTNSSRHYVEDEDDEDDDDDDEDEDENGDEEEVEASASAVSDYKHKQHKQHNIHNTNNTHNNTSLQEQMSRRFRAFLSSAADKVGQHLASAPAGE